MRYRPEIDGLRAIAALAVIFFHAGFTPFGGGYLGVDVFFVISGYLITSLILTQRAAGSFSLLMFYQRRARRLLPALFLVMLCCLPFSWILLLPPDMRHFSISLVAVSAFVSNVWFYLTSGYFDQFTQLKPLFHTWSLGIEEQYYLLFPLALALCWRLGRSWLLGVLIAAGLASLALAQWLVGAHPALAFFLLPTRAWELLLGAALAVWLDARPGAGRPAGRVEELLGVAGLAAVLLPVALFDATTPDPSVFTLLPAAGTALLIAVATPQTVIGRLLASRTLVGVGLISYSAYLWHQPLFAFARHWSLQPPSPLTFAVLSAATFALAWLSWRFVEMPFRRERLLPGRRIFLFAAMGSAVFIAIGLAGAISNGFANRFDAQLLRIFNPPQVAEAPCQTIEPVQSAPGASLCWFGAPDGRRVIALYGDSHADMLQSELDLAFKGAAIRGVRITMPGRCDSSIPGVVRQATGMEDTQRFCAGSFAALLRAVGGRIEGVVISQRWTWKLAPIPGLIDDMRFDNGEGGAEDYYQREIFMARGGDGRLTPDADAKRQAVEQFAQAWLGLGIAVYLVYPVPEVGWHAPAASFRRYIRGQGTELSTAYDRYKERQRFVTAVLDGLNGNIVRIRPEEIFCDAFSRGRCAVVHDGVPYYCDNNHLSRDGVHLLTTRLLLPAIGIRP